MNKQDATFYLISAALLIFGIWYLFGRGGGEQSLETIPEAASPTIPGIDATPRTSDEIVGATAENNFVDPKALVSEVLPELYSTRPKEEIAEIVANLGDEKFEKFRAESHEILVRTTFRHPNQPFEDWQWQDTINRYRWMGERGVQDLTNTLNAPYSRNGGRDQVTETEREHAAFVLRELIDPRSIDGTLKFLENSYDTGAFPRQRRKTTEAIAMIPEWKIDAVQKVRMSDMFRRQLTEETDRDTKVRAARGLANLGFEEGFVWLERDFWDNKNQIWSVYTLEFIATLNNPRSRDFFRQVLLDDVTQYPPNLEEEYDKVCLQYIRNQDEPEFWLNIVYEVKTNPRFALGTRDLAQTVYDRLEAGRRD
ncbi:MAG: hypothetical protein NUW37_19805 [Planctomycetes bacterium]|nr:hypothetical protein [Planctomycetota bacterium]